MNENVNGNYANFIYQIRKKYDKAEYYYKKALEADPEHAHINVSYGGFLLARGRTAEAKPFLDNAEKYVTANDLQLELHFYRLAHFPETAEVSRKAINELLAEGERSRGWDFSQNIEQAEKEGRAYVDELREIAAKISEI